MTWIVAHAWLSDSLSSPMLSSGSATTQTSCGPGSDAVHVTEAGPVPPEAGMSGMGWPIALVVNGHFNRKVLSGVHSERRDEGDVRGDDPQVRGGPLELRHERVGPAYDRVPCAGGGWEG